MRAPSATRLVEDIVLVVLDNTPIVRECTNPEALVLELSPLEERPAVTAQKPQHLVRKREHRKVVSHHIYRHFHFQSPY